MNDLFDRRSKKEKLKDWILDRIVRVNWVRTSDVIAWGSENYNNRALRTAQEFCAAGLYRRMTDQEKDRYSLFSKEDFWVRNDFL
jgi:hypothetical protein